MLPLDGKQPHVPENIQAGEHLPQIQGLSRPADNLAAQAHRGFLHRIRGVQIPPHQRQHLPVGQQRRGLAGGQIPPLHIPVGRGVGQALGIAAGADVDDVHLHGARPTEFIYLGSKGHVH